ncbi:MAG: mechanosensitive ion channel [Chloroflexi bacterium]|nr:mechanosensitive ion channel [Chloroflexota bacterium]
MDPVELVNQLSASLDQALTAESLRIKIAATIILLLVIALIRRVVHRFLDRQEMSVEVRYRVAKTVTYVLYVLAAIFLGAVWFNGWDQLTTILALVLAGAAIALREPLVGMVAWAYIVWRKPFVLGDRVEVDTVRGDVADIGPFVFSLAEVGGGQDAEQPTGRIIHVPNSYIFSHRIANATQGFNYVWDEIPVVVTFESDWRAAKEILEAIVQKRGANVANEAEADFRRATTEFLLRPEAFSPRVFTRVVDIGVELTMRYVVHVRRRRSTREAIWEETLDAFAARTDIDFAYPTQRVFFNPKEGKGAVGNE